MTQSDPIPSDERIVDTMIKLARASKSIEMIVAGCNSSEVLLELHRLGCSRAATTKTCRIPCGQNDVALIMWRDHSIKALATTFDWLVHFLSPATRPVSPLTMLQLAARRVAFGSRAAFAMTLAARPVYPR
jgi:hypothetical protein